MLLHLFFLQDYEEIPVESQGPDLNRSVADLQSAAWPLRHLGISSIHDCEFHYIR